MNNRKIVRIIYDFAYTTAAILIFIVVYYGVQMYWVCRNFKDYQDGEW